MEYQQPAKEFIQVSEAELMSFIENYPGSLRQTANTLMEIFEYHDYSCGAKWPECVVATHDPDYQGGGANQTYRIAKI